MIPKKLTALVLERDGHVCQLDLPGCTYTATVADHRANRGMGGSPKLNTPANLISACVTCNGLKENATGATLARLLEDGLRVTRGRGTEETLLNASLAPVRYRNGDWYLLDAVGGRKYIRTNF